MVTRLTMMTVRTASMHLVPANPWVCFGHCSVRINFVTGQKFPSQNSHFVTCCDKHCES